MATPPQNKEAVPEYAAPTKMQRVPCATYPVHLPSPNYYSRDDGNNDDDDDDDDDYDIPLSNVKVKWYDSDEDS